MGAGRSRKLAALFAGLALFFGPFLAGHALRAALTRQLLPVPLVSQANSWTCGGAALMAALLYFGVYDDPESRLDVELEATPEDGTRVVNIVAVARRFGLTAEAHTHLTLENLEEVLGRGAVVIVALQAWATHPIKNWRADWEDGHYAVVVGLSDDRVYLMDPSIRTGYGYLTRESFLERWHDYDVDGDQRTIYERLGIVIQGPVRLSRYPGEPTPIR